MTFPKHQKTFVVASLFLFVMAAPLTAQAYLDPGTGSLIIQATIAIVAATGLYIKIFWRRIRGFGSFSNKGKKGGDDNTDAESKKPNDYEQQQQQ